MESTKTILIRQHKRLAESEKRPSKRKAVQTIYPRLLELVVAKGFLSVDLKTAILEYLTTKNLKHVDFIASHYEPKLPVHGDQTNWVRRATDLCILVMVGIPSTKLAPASVSLFNSLDPHSGYGIRDLCRKISYLYCLEDGKASVFRRTLVNAMTVVHVVGLYTGKIDFNLIESEFTHFYIEAVYLDSVYLSDVAESTHSAIVKGCKKISRSFTPSKMGDSAKPWSTDDYDRILTTLETDGYLGVITKMRVFFWILKHGEGGFNVEIFNKHSKSFNCDNDWFIMGSACKLARHFKDLNLLQKGWIIEQFCTSKGFTTQDICGF